MGCLCLWAWGLGFRVGFGCLLCVLFCLRVFTDFFVRSDLCDWRFGTVFLGVVLLPIVGGYFSVVFVFIGY